MLSITSNNLGEQGNKIMNVVGVLFLTVAMVAFSEGTEKHNPVISWD